MQKMKRSVLALLLVAILSLAACTQPAQNSSDGGGNANSTADVSEGQTADNGGGEKDLYTIKIFHDSASKLSKWSDTPIGKVVVDMFGVDLELVPMPAGDTKEQMGLMLAGGNYPEIVNLQDQDIADKYIDAGALVALDPYLADMPNFTSWYEESIPYWRLAAGDGNLYNWNMQIPQDYAEFPENNDVAVRIDLLEQQNWEMPVSPDEWIAFLKKAKEDNPTTPDGEPTIGMCAPFGETWGMAGIAPIMYEKGTGIQIANGAVFYDAAADKFLDMFTHPDTKESFQFFNKLYNEGLLDEESFTDKSDQVNAKLQSGRALSLWYVSSMGGAANIYLREKGWDDMQYIKAPVQGQGQIDRGEKNIIMLQLTRPFYTLAITNNAEHPERILEVLDYFSSEEGQILMQSGIEGVHYNRDENGQRVATDEFIDGITNVTDYWLLEGFGIGSVFGVAASSSPADNQPYALGNTEYVVSKTRPDEINNAYEQLGWDSPLGWWMENAEWQTVGVASGVSVNPLSDEGNLETLLTEFRVKNTALLIKAKDDQEFESLYASLVAEYNSMNPEIVVDKYNEVYQQGLNDLAQYQK